VEPVTRRLLLVVGSAPCTRRAVIVAAALARDWDAEVIVCRARTKRPSRGGPITSEALDHARDAVDAAGDALVRLGTTVPERLVLTSLDRPAEAVLRAARHEAVSMVVVTHPGWRSFSDWQSTREARRLLSRSEVPVLVVGPDRVRIRRSARQRAGGVPVRPPRPRDRSGARGRPGSG
jgi:nucleotide-binding universal stress UspA family protein